MFDFSTLNSSRLLIVKAKPRRVYNAINELLRIWESNYFSPTCAARMFGKLDFLNQTLFGKVGRVALLEFKKRQMQGPKESMLMTKELIHAFVFVIELLLTAPPRMMPTNLAEIPPVLLYTDGSSEEKRNPKHVVGAVVILPRSGVIKYTWCPVPDEIVDRWLPSKNQIFLVELFAGPMALDTFGPELANQPVIHFCDNNAALGALVKGYSNKECAIKIVADYWLRAAQLRSYVYIDRVESSSNISDDPSRMCVGRVLENLGGIFVKPELRSLVQPSSVRDPEFWYGDGKARWNKLLERIQSEQFLPTPTPPAQPV